MEKLVIKSERARQTVANIIAKKVSSKLAATYGDVCSVDVKDVGVDYTWVIIRESHHGVTLAVIDSVREITDAYENRYEIGQVSTYLDTYPYLASDNETWLYGIQLVVSVRNRKED